MVSVRVRVRGSSLGLGFMVSSLGFMVYCLRFTFWV